MQNQEITAVAVLMVALTFLWRGLNFVLDILFKKDTKDKDKNSDKLDLLLTMVQEQHISIERINNKLEHNYERMVIVEKKEYDLREIVQQQRSTLAELKEWKRITTKN